MLSFCGFCVMENIFLPSINLNRRRQFFILFCGVSALCTIWKSLWSFCLNSPSSAVSPRLTTIQSVRAHTTSVLILCRSWHSSFFEPLILILCLVMSVKSNGTFFTSYLILSWLKWFLHVKFLQVQYNLLYFLLYELPLCNIKI